MWRMGTTDLLLLPKASWADMSGVLTETVVAASASSSPALILDMAGDAGYFSDTAFACIHNTETEEGAPEWGLVQLDGLCTKGDTAVLRLFRTHESVVNFIALRYYHRILHPLR